MPRKTEETVAVGVGTEKPQRLSGAEISYLFASETASEPINFLMHGKPALVRIAQMDSDSFALYEDVQRSQYQFDMKGVRSAEDLNVTGFTPKGAELEEILLLNSVVEFQGWVKNQVLVDGRPTGEYQMSAYNLPEGQAAVKNFFKRMQKDLKNLIVAEAMLKNGLADEKDFQPAVSGE